MLVLPDVYVQDDLVTLLCSAPARDLDDFSLMTCATAQMHAHLAVQPDLTRSTPLSIQIQPPSFQKPTATHRYLGFSPLSIYSPCCLHLVKIAGKSYSRAILRAQGQSGSPGSRLCWQGLKVLQLWVQHLGLRALLCWSLHMRCLDQLVEDL